MIKVNIRPLPKARVPFDDVKDPVVRQKIMLLNDNITSLGAQLAELQRAVIELQNRKIAPTGANDYAREHIA